MRMAHLQDFIDVYNTDNRHKEQKLGTKKILTVGGVNLPMMKS
jgi:hypothetical protein